MLITVGVILDTMRQIETFLLQRHYDGFLKKGRIRARSANRPARRDRRRPGDEAVDETRLAARRYVPVRHRRLGFPDVFQIVFFTPMAAPSFDPFRIWRSSPKRNSFCSVRLIFASGRNAEPGPFFAH
jgi:hypothetical protein